MVEKSFDKMLEKILDDNGIYLYSEDITAPLDIDSLTFISLLVDIEETFNILISPDDLVGPPNTYEDLCIFIRRLLAGSGVNL